MALKRARLDQLMTERGLVPTRSKAQALIMAGQVRVVGHENPKPGMSLPEDAAIEVLQVSPWVGRGGEKLAGAIEDFGLAGKLGGVWLDCGVGTGGFTDVLLANGVEKVYAVDVGYGQLDPRLRDDPRVVVMERTNIRKIEPAQLPEPLAGVTLDLSFISLRLVLPVLRPFLAPDADLVVLVKPQFEGQREDVGKGGIVRSDKIRERILHDFLVWCGDNGWRIMNQTPSRITGRQGNQEYLVHLRAIAPA